MTNTEKLRLVYKLIKDVSQNTGYKPEEITYIYTVIGLVKMGIMKDRQTKAPPLEAIAKQRDTSVLEVIREALTASYDDLKGHTLMRAASNVSAEEGAA